MKSPHQTKIERFMLLAGQTLPAEPTLADPDVRRLRANLILEEALETLKALGFCIVIRSGEIILSRSGRTQLSLHEIVDGCADLSVVTIGTLSALGVEDMSVLDIVDDNNLAKFGPGGYKRTDGKWIKPPGHKPPDFTPVFKDVTS